MKLITLSRRHRLSFNIYRYISSEIWTRELDDDTKKEIEKYWSQKFKYDNHFNKSISKNKFYILSMFPYPSGNLHLGHVRVYTIADTVARFHRMNGKNPMGWDAFGLPAENAAIERGISPKNWTDKNIAQMRNQFEKLRCTFDWQNEINTSLSDYYKWTQYIFLKMYDAGLVYQKEAVVNWDPIDETVLADEQVDSEGRSWRSGAKIEKKVLKQWFIRTTRFSKDLYDGLSEEELLDWDDVIDIQKNWIGECDGVSFDFRIEGHDGVNDTNSLNIWVKDPSSVLAAEFIVVQPNTLPDILCNYQRETNGKLDLNAVNPFTNQSLPIYVSADVPYPFGRDVYVGVPSNSEFDLKFAMNVGLVPSPSTKSTSPEDVCRMAKKLNIGGYPVSSKIKDWLISRQRYWGTPIPMVHCFSCGVQAVPYEQLPVELPPLPSNFKIGKALNTFLKSSDWINTSCLKCGGKAVREIDTMDTFVDSSWYYLRYMDCTNEKEPFNSDVVNCLMPVDLYVGGKEHAVLHLYYARFFSYFLHSIGLVKQREPFVKLLCQGMVKGRTYKTKEGRYLKPDEVVIEGEIAKSKETNEILTVTWEKMSKSKYNGVDPGEILEKYGVDTTRLLLLFSIAPKSHREWNSNLFKDVFVWQRRLWLTIQELQKIRQQPLPMDEQPWINMSKEDACLRYARNKYVRGVTYNYSVSQQLASCISYLQGLNNSLRKSSRIVRKYSSEYEKSLAALIIMLTPITPHFAAALWQGFTEATGRVNTECDEINWDLDVLHQKWPSIDANFEVPIYLKINGGPAIEAGVPSSEVPTLTLERALKFCRKIPKIKRTLNTNDILDAKLKLHENVGAEILLTMKAKKDTDIKNSKNEQELVQEG